MLLAELKSNGIMDGMLNLAQVLVIHLLHYSAVTQTITPRQEFNSHSVATSDQLYSHSPERDFD